VFILTEVTEGGQMRIGWSLEMAPVNYTAQVQSLKV
jgi:hypothetical protein